MEQSLDQIKFSRALSDLSSLLSLFWVVCTSQRVGEVMIMDLAQVDTVDGVATHVQEKGVESKIGEEVVIASSGNSQDGSQDGQTPLVPLKMKLLSILLVTAVGFGSHWSSGVTGAMKSTLKKVNHPTLSRLKDPIL
jgi:hypothetical protein